MPDGLHALAVLELSTTLLSVIHRPHAQLANERTCQVPARHSKHEQIAAIVGPCWTQTFSLVPRRYLHAAQIALY